MAIPALTAALALLASSAFAAPAGWTRAAIDVRHATLAPGLHTIEAWMPPKAQAGSALYYAVGDGGGTLDALVARAKGALPAGAAIAEERAVTLCDGLPGRTIVYVAGSIAGEETIASGAVFAAVALYERPRGEPEDAAALTSIATLCPQAETSPEDA